MFDIFQHTTRPNKELFFRKNDANDIRLGEIVPNCNYDESEVVILGCPQDEGVRRNGGRVGAALAPEAIRRQFYKLTPFGISAKVFDAGDTIIKDSLEATHDLHTKIVEQFLRDGKKLIVLGGGNDTSYADGCAMANVFGADKWLGINTDAHFDVRADQPRNSGTPYRQLLEEKFIAPENFYEIAYQPQATSPVYYDYLRNYGVNLTSLDEFDNSEFESQIRERISNAGTAIFWGFDVDAVQSSDAPGTSAPSPIGLSAREFCNLAKFAGSLSDTKIVEFTEVNPNYDIDNRTAKLVAVAMHNFLSAIKKEPTE
jgi:formiminoglutamase